MSGTRSELIQKLFPEYRSLFFNWLPRIITMRDLEECLATGALKLEELQHPPLIGGRKRKKNKRKEKGNEREKKKSKSTVIYTRRKR